MKLTLAFLVWFLMSAVLGLGIYLMVLKSFPWLFIVVAITLIAMVAKFGCSTH